jgi:hypothetical protein
MDTVEAQARLAEIQRIMQRTTLNSRLPGWPAIIAGLMVLAAAAFSWLLLGGSVDMAALYGVGLGRQWAFCILWAVVGVAAFGQEILIARWAAQRAGQNSRTRPGRLAVLSLTPSVAVAALLSLRILWGENVDEYGAAGLRLLPPIWMMCYGTGVYAAGLFSVRLPRLLGLGFIVLGGAALLPRIEQAGVLLIAASFGLLHVLFGLLVLRADGRRNDTEHAETNKEHTEQSQSTP